MVIIPNAGNSMMGNKDVTGMGNTSVAQYTASNSAIPAVCQAWADSPAGAGSQVVMRKRPNPIIKPIFLIWREGNRFPPYLLKTMPADSVIIQQVK